MKILLVENSVEVAQFVKATLEARGYEVVNKGTALDALNSIFDDDFALILLKYNLPDIDGMRLYQLMHLALKTTPIVLITGHADKFDPTVVSGLGVNGVLTKPLDTDQLLTLILKLTQPDKFQRLRDLGASLQAFILEFFSVKRQGIAKS